MMSELHNQPNTQPKITPVSFVAGGIGADGAVGEVHLVELDVPHTTLPTDPESIAGFLQPRMGWKRLNILKPFIDEPGGQLTTRDAAEIAGIAGTSKKVTDLFKDAKARLAQTPYRRWLATEDRQPDPNLHSWDIPMAVASPKPIHPQLIGKMIGAHLLSRAPFPILPYDGHHRRAIDQVVREGRGEYRATGNDARLRLAGVELTYRVGSKRG